LSNGKLYRRKDDHQKVYRAVRYGNDNRSWDTECTSRIAKFVLGLDVDTRVVLENERVMDVVQPIQDTWNPAHWVADIEVADWPRGARYKMSLGDWLIKDEQGVLAHVKPLEFVQQYERVPKVDVRYTQFNELSDLIYKNFPWEGETYQAVAENVASEIMNSGWSKPI
jgi:hypothetical protein